jgi:transcriptional regulator with XRE-family HTH domain
MIIGQRIKQLREERGWQQKELAAKLNLRQSAVSAWETNLNGPNPTQRKKLCKIFSISEAELYGGMPSQINPEILAALQDPIAVKALLITFKNTQDIKDAIKTFLDCLPNLPPKKRQALLALCK